jgi:glyoxylase-like metal-dependent hydrolase (beta-lactamase superfamily II)
MLKNCIGRIGGVEISRVLDSCLLGETMQAWFPDFDRGAVQAHEHWLCPQHYDAESGHFAMPVHSWVLRVNGCNVLIDTCMGNGKTRPLLNEMHMLNNRYLERLAEVGLTPADVDYVLCTHLHVDHVGWNTVLKNGRWVPAFPNAKYVFARKEYETAKEDAANPHMPAFMRHVFQDSVHPVVEAGKSLLVDGVHELLETLTLRPAPGHSPGHLRIELKSKGEFGVFAGDLLHSPIQVPFWQWSSRVCWNPALSATSRRELLEFCVAQNAVLLPGHFTAPHVGRIGESNGTFSIEFGW